MAALIAHQHWNKLKKLNFPQGPNGPEKYPKTDLQKNGRFNLSLKMLQNTDPFSTQWFAPPALT